MPIRKFKSLLKRYDALVAIPKVNAESERVRQLNDGEYRGLFASFSRLAEVPDQTDRPIASLSPVSTAIRLLLDYRGQSATGVTLDRLQTEGQAQGGWSARNGWDHDVLGRLVERFARAHAWTRESLSTESVCGALLDNMLPLVSIRPRGEEEHSRIVLVHAFRMKAGRPVDLLIHDPSMHAETEWMDAREFSRLFSGNAIMLSVENDTSWAEIDLSAIRHNVSSIKDLIGDECEILAVVKADAYGHGIVEVAKTLCSTGKIYGLAVASMSEALLLRDEGITQPILVLYHVSNAEVETAIKSEIAISLYSQETLTQLDASTRRLRMRAKVHLVVDTGMGWYGLAPTEVTEFAEQVKMSEYIDIDGLYTHFSRADADSQAYTHEQITRFEHVIEELEAHGVRPHLIHAANSAAALSLPESRFNLVRPGLSLYGYPSKNCQVPLRPAMSFKTRVIQIREREKGTPIGYGGHYETPEDSRIAVIPIGYSDGLSRVLSGRDGRVIVHGQLAPIRGNICMNVTMIDVTHIEPVRPGDIVTIMGRQGDVVLDAEDLALAEGTISYEVLTSIGGHVPRIFVECEGAS
jgi:alanine racemase